jgi:hypothetical protein
MKTCKLNVQGHVISMMQLPKNNNTCGLCFICELQTLKY